MKIINIQELRAFVEKHPLKQIRGRFRVSIPFGDWTFSADGEDPEKPSQAFADFLKKEKPTFVLLAEDNSFSVTFAVTSPEIFDGDGPNEDSEIFFLIPDHEEFPGAPLLLFLKTTSGWPDWEGGGEFIAQFNF